MSGIGTLRVNIEILWPKICTNLKTQIIFLSLELSCDNEAIVNNFSFVIEVIGKKEHKVAAQVVSAVGVVQQYLKQ